jgi:putative glutamine amidotransferase
MAARIGVTYCGELRIGAYETALHSVGLETVRLMPERPHSLDNLNGLLLTGGTDVNPKYYGEAPVQETDESDEARDAMELSLIAEALSLDLPVFAICRGLQLLNVHLHGSLVQHLPSVGIHERRLPGEKPRQHQAVHSVRVAENTLLQRIVHSNEIQVNSRHHQAINRLGEGLVASAVSEDGVIEAIEYPARHFVLGVQWHPEDRIESGPSDLALFAAFAKALGS